MKTVKLDREVTDTSGLFFDLVRGEFEVVSIAVEGNATYIHLEDEEEKDPLPVLEMWADRAPIPPSKSTTGERLKIYGQYLEEKPSRMEALKARQATQREISIPAFVDPGYEASPSEPPMRMLSIEPRQKEGWLTKLKKLW